MWRGSFAIGSDVPLQVLCIDEDEEPAAVTNPPVLTIFAPGFTQVGVPQLGIPVDINFGQVGLFLLPVFLDNSFTAGNIYTARWTWRAPSGFFGMSWDQFEVIPTGHADGAVISMTWYNRPNGKFVVQHMDSGKIVRSRNPYVR